MRAAGIAAGALLSSHAEPRPFYNGLRDLLIFILTFTLVRLRTFHKRAEQTMTFTTRARGEEERIHWSAGRGPGTEGDSPEAVDCERLPISGGLKLAALLILAIAFRLTGIEGVDHAVA